MIITQQIADTLVQFSNQAKLSIPNSSNTNIDSFLQKNQSLYSSIGQHVALNAKQLIILNICDAIRNSKNSGVTDITALKVAAFNSAKTLATTLVSNPSSYNSPSQEKIQACTKWSRAASLTKAPISLRNIIDGCVAIV